MQHPILEGADDDLRRVLAAYDAVNSPAKVRELDDLALAARRRATAALPRLDARERRKVRRLLGHVSRARSHRHEKRRTVENLVTVLSIAVLIALLVPIGALFFFGRRLRKCRNRRPNISPAAARLSRRSFSVAAELVAELLTVTSPSRTTAPGNSPELPMKSLRPLTVRGDFNAARARVDQREPEVEPGGRRRRGDSIDPLHQKNSFEIEKTRRVQLIGIREPIQISVVHAARVALHDGEGGAGHLRRVDARAFTDAAHQRCLARAQIAGQTDEVSAL
jgi:hypothetical protein